jgi:hypothetical protein
MGSTEGPPAPGGQPLPARDGPLNGCGAAAVSDLWFAVGLVVVLLTGASVLFTVVLPREPRGVQRLSFQVIQAVHSAFITFSRLAKSYEGKDTLLAPIGPVVLIGQLAFWAGLLIVGFGLMLDGTTHDLVAALAQAAGAVFTVGTVDLSGPPNAGVDIAAGATWVVIVTLQIAYLPALYQAFSRRESLVAMLESRAGLPAWGPEILARHQLVGIIDTLPDFYASWEEWSADLAESHTTYPVLLLFRSPEAWYSWLVGLLAVLDGAAMHLALAPTTASSQSRLCLRMGFTSLNRIAMMLGWTVETDPDPNGDIALTFAEFENAVAMLQRVGFPMERSAEQAWPDFRGWRINYETVAYRLCERLDAPPAPWSGSRHHLSSGPVAPRRPPQRTPGLPSRSG